MTSLIVLDNESEKCNVVQMKDGYVVCGNVALEGSFFIMSNVKMKRKVTAKTLPRRLIEHDGGFSRPEYCQRDYAISVSRVSVRESTVETIKSYSELPDTEGWAMKDEATAQADADRAQVARNREIDEKNVATYAKIQKTGKEEFTYRAQRDWDCLPMWRRALLTLKSAKKGYIEQQSEAERIKFLEALDSRLRLSSYGFDLEMLKRG